MLAKLTCGITEAINPRLSNSLLYAISQVLLFLFGVVPAFFMAVLGEWIVGKGNHDRTSKLGRIF
jgi:hypothetical protein